MGYREMKPLFPLGQVYMTAGVANLELPKERLFGIIHRHHCGDWGDVCEEDKNQNDLDLDHEGRLVSRYNIEEASLYIITEWDRSLTTVMLIEEY